MGPQYCRFSPKLYIRVLMCGDLISVGVQAVGGVIATNAHNKAGADSGARIMLTGFCSQLSNVLVFSGLFLEVIWRHRQDRPAKAFRVKRTRPDVEVPRGLVSTLDQQKAKLLIIAIGLSIVCIVIRCCFRAGELLNGWRYNMFETLVANSKLGPGDPRPPEGPHISNELLFCILDGAMVS